MKHCILPMLLIAVAGCNSHEAPAQFQAQASDRPVIELKSDLLAPDFKNALVGKWTSVFSYKSKRNIAKLEFKHDGTASLSVIRGNDRKQYSGPYSVVFDRTPRSGFVTFATITINPEKENPLVLSRVHLGLHNGVDWRIGPLLRIDKEPRGVLRRQTNQGIKTDNQ